MDNQPDNTEQLVTPAVLTLVSIANTKTAFGVGAKVIATMAIAEAAAFLVSRGSLPFTLAAGCVSLVGGYLFLQLLKGRQMVFAAKLIQTYGIARFKLAQPMVDKSNAILREVSR